MKNIHIIVFVLITSFVFSSCTKKISSDKLQVRNDIAYEVGSEKPYSGKIVDYYDQNKKMLKYESDYNLGFKNGKTIEYFENGQVKSSSTYLNGKLDGVQSTYYSNGQIESETNYKNGVMAEYKSWLSNGTLDIQCSFKNNQPFGKLSSRFSFDKEQPLCDFVIDSSRNYTKFKYLTHEGNYYLTDLVFPFELFIPLFKKSLDERKNVLGEPLVLNEEREKPVKDILMYDFWAFNRKNFDLQKDFLDQVGTAIILSVSMIFTINDNRIIENSEKHLIDLGFSKKAKHEFTKKYPDGTAKVSLVKLEQYDQKLGFLVLFR